MAEKQTTKKSTSKKPKSDGSLSLKTATGMGINDIANSLAASAFKGLKDKLSPSKKKEQSAAPEASVPETSSTASKDNNSKGIKGLFKLIKKVNNAPAVIGAPAATTEVPSAAQTTMAPKAEKLGDEEIKKLTDKIDELEKIIKNQKVEKVSPNQVAMMSPEEKQKHQKAEQIKTVNTRDLEDARSALMGLGIKKQEAEDALKGVQPGTSLPEMIREALKKIDDKKNGRAQRIPKEEVAPAVAAVTPSTPTTTPTIAPVATAPTVTPVTPKIESAAIAPVAPVPSQTADSGNQEKATSAAEKAKKDKEQMERDKQQKQMLDDLEKIKKNVSDKSPNDLINNAFAFLGKKIWGFIAPALSSIAGPLMAGLAQAAAVIGVGIATYEGAKWLLDKVGYKGESLGKLFSSQEKDVAKADAAQKADYEKFTIKQNEKLKGTGFSFNGGSYVNNQTGEKLKVQQLPQDVRAKLTPAAQQVPAAAQTDNAAKVGVVNPPPKSDAIAATVAPPVTAREETNPADQSKGSQTGVAPPMVIAPTIQQSSSKSQPQKMPSAVMIKVRNDEPTVAGIVAQLFEHPVSFGAVYRM